MREPLASNMKTLMLLAGLVIIALPAFGEDWTDATDGIKIKGQVAFPGCAKAGSGFDTKALRVATLRAQANKARAESKVVSGREQLQYGNNHDQYGVTIYETSKAYMNKVSVIDSKIAMIDDVQQLCVLIVEDSSLNKEKGP